MEMIDEDSDFAESAGLRLEQAFALCSFASQLAGKAGREQELRDTHQIRDTKASTSP